MKLFKRYYLASYGMSHLLEAMRAVDQMLDQIFTALARISPGPPVNDARCENIDGVWLVAQFGAAATNATFLHKLGRVPVGLIQVEALPDPGEAVVAGVVSLVTATKSDVTLQSTGANKKARVILF